MTGSSETQHSNPLLPLILLLMLVILLTVIISNLKPDTGNHFLNGLEPIPEQAQTASSFDKEHSPVFFKNFNEDQVIRNAARNWRIGKISEAESDFRTILVFDPENLAALSYLGTIFYFQNKLKEAEFMFRKKTALYPSQAIGFRNLGLALFRQDRYAEAIQALKRASSLDPMNMDHVILLARMYAYIGDQQNAAACLQRAKMNGKDLSEILKENIFRTLLKSNPYVLPSSGKNILNKEQQ